MYKFYLFPAWILAVLLFGSCSSDESTNDQTSDEANAVTVTFNVRAKLETTTEPIDNHQARSLTRAAATTSGEKIEDVVRLISYDIYKDGSRYKYGSSSFDPKTEQAPDDFGTFKEKLLPGKYTVLFYAYGKVSENVTLSDESSLNKFNITSGELELFEYCESITVTTSTTTVDVTLKRVSAMMSLQISDDPLPEVSYITIVLTGNGFYYPYNKANNSNPSAFSITKRTNVVDGKLPVTNIYTVNPKNPAQLTIYIRDADGNTLGQSTVSVPMYANRRSVVSGNLFTFLGDKPMSVIIDDTWGQDVSVPLN